MHALSTHVGPIEIFFNFIQIPLSVHIACEKNTITMMKDFQNLKSALFTFCAFYSCSPSI